MGFRRCDSIWSTLFAIYSHYRLIRDLRNYRTDTESIGISSAAKNYLCEKTTTALTFCWKHFKSSRFVETILWKTWKMPFPEIINNETKSRRNDVLNTYQVHYRPMIVFRFHYCCPSEPTAKGTLVVVGGSAVLQPGSRVHLDPLLNTRDNVLPIEPHIYKIKSRLWKRRRRRRRLVS